MKTILLRSGVILLACTGASAHAASILDNYTVEWSKKISTKEASSVAYNWDKNRLMVTNDEEAKGSGSNYYATFGEYDMNGNMLSTITVNGCESIPNVFDKKRKCDPEGLTYIGNDTYVVASERIQDIFKLTSSSTDGDRTYTSFATAPQISVAGDSDNKGLEGIAFDTVTGNYWGVGETGLVYKITNANWTSESAAVTTAFSLSGSFDSLNDIAVLSKGIYAGTSAANNLLVLTSGDANNGSEMNILEVNQSGTVLGVFSLADLDKLIDPDGVDSHFEGITLDADGNIYLVSDDGDGSANQSYMVKLKFNAPAVPEPATWALMIAGFGLVGAGIRRQKVAVRFA